MKLLNVLMTIPFLGLGLGVAKADAPTEFEQNLVHLRRLIEATPLELDAYECR